MTNPFLANNAAPAAPAQTAPAPQTQAPAPAPQAAPAQNTAPVAQGAAAIGGVPSVDSADPFASPTGGETVPGSVTMSARPFSSGPPSTSRA